MAASWSLTIADALDEFWLRCPPVDVGGGQVQAAADFYVLAAGPSRLRFDLRYRPEDYRSRIEAITWHEWFAFGFGGRAVLWREDGARHIFDLGCYFQSFAPQDDCLLTVSGNGIVCIGIDGALLWRNDALAVDGVVVTDVTDGAIEGDGEWDPPGGWRPFRISRTTGRPV